MGYLKENEYYDELYDKLTVDNMRRLEGSIIKGKSKVNYSESFLLKTFTYFKAGNTAKNKREIIEKWMQLAREKDEMLNKKQPPNITCFLCEEDMVLDDKFLENEYKSKKHWWIQFMYRCTRCKVSSTIEKLNERKDYIPWMCPSCSKKMIIKKVRNGEIIQIKHDCTFCGYAKNKEIDLNEFRSKEKQLSRKEKIQFNFDKRRFCFSAEQLEEYERTISLLEMFKNHKKPLR